MKFPLDPRDPESFIAYKTFFDDDEPTRPPVYRGTGGSVKLLWALIFVAVVIVLAVLMH